ncbi:hypothetical protein [Paeniglutamicibacter cryotolerans]|uniref:Berberine/berberine-like domain-containing protein n=1 Tax=Paeniglutamicibacter cryotolerans TaxID=670079 RepID=A0A839QKP0_9MICC|nr:hypothetical protein [Paeniglutamicibacter cryotolerans]MBB2996968.1 hypothetical protein [Paeniglutamicibacter cryotolerans]
MRSPPLRSQMIIHLRFVHIGSVQGAPNAVGGRDAAFSFYIVGPCMPPIQANVEASGSGSWPPWSRGTPVPPPANSTGGHSVETHNGRFWPKPIRDRLLALRRDRDPAGRFSFGVGPT